MRIPTSKTWRRDCQEPRTGNTTMRVPTGVKSPEQLWWQATTIPHLDHLAFQMLWRRSGHEGGYKIVSNFLDTERSIMTRKTKETLPAWKVSSCYSSAMSEQLFNRGRKQNRNDFLIAGFMSWPVHTAIMIEIMRLLRLKKDRPIDVIFFFNSAEETIQPGAHGFITKNKWAKNICCGVHAPLLSCYLDVLRLEARFGCFMIWMFYVFMCSRWTSNFLSFFNAWSIEERQEVATQY